MRTFNRKDVLLRSFDDQTVQMAELGHTILPWMLTPNPDAFDVGSELGHVYDALLFFNKAIPTLMGGKELELPQDILAIRALPDQYNRYVALSARTLREAQRQYETLHLHGLLDGYVQQRKVARDMINQTPLRDFDKVLSHPIADWRPGPLDYFCNRAYNAHEAEHFFGIRAKMLRAAEAYHMELALPRRYQVLGNST